MRPIPIPDTVVMMDAGKQVDVIDTATGGALPRMVISPPDGDLTNDRIRPVEALVGVDPEQGPIVTVLVALEDGDLDRLQSMERPAVWLSMYTGQIPPFAVEVADGRG